MHFSEKIPSTIFITGIGTEVGKTLVSALFTESLRANYWKPIQAGIQFPTDSDRVGQLISNSKSRILEPMYNLEMPASPHIAAKSENIEIEIDKIAEQFIVYKNACDVLIVEGPGGLLVPLSEKYFVLDLIEKLNTSVILVSRNYLGSINHSLLTASICKIRQLQVLGWVFNDNYLDYENEIVNWSGYKKLFSVPKFDEINKQTISRIARQIRDIEF